MASDEGKISKALHDLVATCNDSAEGYGKAAKGVHDDALSDRLAQISGERLRFAEELTKLATASGEAPRNDLHEGGILHSGWVDLETRIRPKTQRDILEDGIRGDEGTLKHYDHALALNPANPTILRDQRRCVERDLEFLRGSLTKTRAQKA